jgi:hypothetical protein
MLCFRDDPHLLEVMLYFSQLAGYVFELFVLSLSDELHGWRWIHCQIQSPNKRDTCASSHHARSFVEALIRHRLRGPNPELNFRIIYQLSCSCAAGETQAYSDFWDSLPEPVQPPDSQISPDNIHQCWVSW